MLTYINIMHTSIFLLGVDVQTSPFLAQAKPIGGFLLTLHILPSMKPPFLSKDNKALRKCHYTGVSGRLSNQSTMRSCDSILSLWACSLGYLWIWGNTPNPGIQCHAFIAARSAQVIYKCKRNLVMNDNLLFAKKEQMRLFLKCIKAKPLYCQETGCCPSVEEYGTWDRIKVFKESQHCWGWRYPDKT